MGYAAAVDKRKPWLTGNKTTQGLEDMMAKAAIEIFEIMFDNVDLSGELAGLNFAGTAQPKDSPISPGVGFGDKPSLPKKKSAKRKRR
jgi:hypothetical protein